MAALYDFGKKFGRKIQENLPNFFFRKKHFKTRSETRFHQNHQNRSKRIIGRDLKKSLRLNMRLTVVFLKAIRKLQCDFRIDNDAM